MKDHEDKYQQKRSRKQVYNAASDSFLILFKAYVIGNFCDLVRFIYKKTSKGFGLVVIAGLSLAFMIYGLSQSSMNKEEISQNSSQIFTLQNKVDNNTATVKKEKTTGKQTVQSANANGVNSTTVTAVKKAMKYIYNWDSTKSYNLNRISMLAMLQNPNSSNQNLNSFFKVDNQHSISDLDLVSELVSVKMYKVAQTSTTTQLVVVARHRNYYSDLSTTSQQTPAYRIYDVTYNSVLGKFTQFQISNQLNIVYDQQ